jgi:hypothetical protein
MTRLLSLVLAAAVLAGSASAMPICHDPRSGRLVNCPHAAPLPRCLNGRLCGTACIPRNKFCSVLSGRPNIPPKL